MAVTAAEDGATAGNITIDSYAALHAGVTTVTDLQTGTISAADGATAATVADSTGVITLSGDLSVQVITTSPTWAILLWTQSVQMAQTSIFLYQMTQLQH
jgi:uncharacterized protein (DUF983 family)